MLSVDTKTQEVGVDIAGEFCDIHRARDLREKLLKRIAVEPDPEKIEAGVKDLVIFNSAIAALEQVEVAREQAREARRQQLSVERKTAGVAQQEFAMNCFRIAHAHLGRSVKGLKGVHPYGEDPAEKFFKKALNEYVAELGKVLSYADAEKQVDEILTAELKRRDWEAIVKLPAISQRVMNYRPM